MAGIGAAAAPVGLGGHLVLRQAATGQHLAQGQDDLGLAQQVSLPAAGQQLDFRGLGGQPGRLARRAQCRFSVTVRIDPKIAAAIAAIG